MWHHSHDNEKQKKTYNRNNVANKHWKSKRPITNRCHAQGIYRLSVIQNLPFLCRPKHFTSCCQPKHITSLAQPKLRTSFCQLKHIASLSIRTNTEHTRGHFAISRNGSSSADVICNENVTPMTLHAFSSHHEESRETQKEPNTSTKILTKFWTADVRLASKPPCHFNPTPKRHIFVLHQSTTPNTTIPIWTSHVALLNAPCAGIYLATETPHVPSLATFAKCQNTCRNYRICRTTWGFKRAMRNNLFSSATSPTRKLKRTMCESACSSLSLSLCLSLPLSSLSHTRCKLTPDHELALKTKATWIVATTCHIKKLLCCSESPNLMIATGNLSL